MNNVHASLVALDGRGVLITGMSGSGKTLLALHLYRRCIQARLTAQIIADDQVLLSIAGSKLVGTAPETIRGQIEVRGFGVVDHQMELFAHSVDLHVKLTDAQDIVRYHDGQRYAFETVSVPSLTLSAACVEAAGNAVLAALGLPLWV